MRLKTAVFSGIITLAIVWLAQHQSQVPDMILDLIILGQVPGTDVVLRAEIIFLGYGIGGAFLTRYWVDFKNGYWSNVYRKLQNAKTIARQGSSDITEKSQEIITATQTPQTS